MTSARLAARRPLFQCLHTPPSAPLRRLNNPQLRTISKRSPAERVSLHRENVLRRQQYIKRRNWFAVGAALSMIAPMVLVQFWDVEPIGATQQQTEKSKGQEGKSVMEYITGPPTKTEAPRVATDEFQGKKVVVAAGDKIIAAPRDAEHPTATDVDAIELVETGTSYVPYFPRTVRLPTGAAGPEALQSEEEYTLLGMGIRKVSFLKIQVYVVGLYVKTADLSSLQTHLIRTVNPIASTLIRSEKDSLKDNLLDGEQSEQIWNSILNAKGPNSVDMALRIVPCRGTDFKHLQDAMMRGIASRTDEVRRKQADLLRQQAAEQKQISLPKPVSESEFTDESFGLAMKDFKSLFQGRGKAPKGSVVILARYNEGQLDGMFQTVVKTNKGEKMGEMVPLGTVRDPRVGTLVWQIYLGGPQVSSEDARKNIVDGCVGITERPVGTVEGMVN